MLACGSSKQQFTVDSGVNKLKLPLAPGKITISMVRNGRTLINQTPADFTYSSNPDLCKLEDPSLAWNWTKTFSDNFNVYVGSLSELSWHFHHCWYSSIQQKQVSQPQSQCIPHWWIVRIPRRRHSRIHLWQSLPTLPRLRLASKGRGIIMVALTKVRRGHVERSLDHRIQEKLWRLSCVRTFAQDIHLLVLNTGKSFPTLLLLLRLTKNSRHECMYIESRSSFSLKYKNSKATVATLWPTMGPAEISLRHQNALYPVLAALPRFAEGHGRWACLEHQARPSLLLQQTLVA